MSVFSVVHDVSALGVETGSPWSLLQVLGWHEATVTRLQFCPRPQHHLLASCSKDTSVRIASIQL